MLPSQFGTDRERGQHVKNSQTAVQGMDLNDGVYVYVCSIKQHMVLVGDLLASCLKYRPLLPYVLSLSLALSCMRVDGRHMRDDSETHIHIMIE